MRHMTTNFQLAHCHFALAAIAAFAFAATIVAAEGPSDLATAQKAFQALANDKDATLDALSNAVQRIFASTNATADARARALIDFGKVHKDRQLVSDTLACYEEAAAMAGVSPKVRAAALGEEAAFFRNLNFKDRFGTYRHDDLDRAASLRRRILALDGLTPADRVAASKALADTLLDIEQDLVDEAVKLYEALPDTPGLSPAEKWKAELMLGDFYVRSVQDDKARAIFERLLAEGPDLKIHQNDLRGLARRLVRIVEAQDGEGKAYEFITTGAAAKWYDNVAIADFCAEHGRAEEAARRYAEYMNDDSQRASSRAYLLNGRLGTSYANRGLKAMKAYYETEVLAFLRANTNQWPNVLGALHNRGFRGTAAATTPEYNDWLLEFAALAPDGKGYSLVQSYEIASKGSDPAKTLALAREIVALGTNAPAPSARSAGLCVAVLSAGNDGRSAVANVEKWIAGHPTEDGKTHAAFYLDAARMAQRQRLENAARALFAAYLGQMVPRPPRSLDCPFVADAPQDIAGILASDFYTRAKKGIADRKYGENLQFLLDTDAASTSRKVESADSSARFPEIFSFCDERGVKILINVYMEPEEMRKFKEGFERVPGFESYLVTGIDTPYHCLMFNPPSIDLSEFVTQYDNETGFRNLSTRKGTLCLTYHESADCYSTLLSVSWKAVAANLPEEGSTWAFEPLIWMRGGLTWGGSESVGNRSCFGTLVFRNLTSANITAIRRGLLPYLKGIYDAAKKARSHGQIEVWMDSELGDRAFYFECLEPFVKRLDTYASRVKPGMPDADVDDVYLNAAADWFNVDYRVSAMRKDYLDAKRVRGE